MIIRGKPAGNAKWWANHLLSDKNDRASIKEMAGVLSDDLHAALQEMRWISKGSRCQGDFMYQANINPQKGEYLTEEQWKEAVDTLEKNLGLEGHQRVVVEHEKFGRVHRDVIWNRIDVDTMRVADMGGNWRTHERTQTELEKRFGLEPTPARSKDGKASPELWEHRAAERSGIDRDSVKAELTDLWRTTDSGQAFKAAIEERGYILAKGDRRDFCVVDHAGDAHSLARRLDGVRTAEVRARMADIDRNSLPSVEEAHATQKARTPFGKTTDRPAQSENYWERRSREAGDDRRQAEQRRDARDDVFGRKSQPDEKGGKSDRRDKSSEGAKSSDGPQARSKAGQAAPGLQVFDKLTGSMTRLVEFASDFLLGGGPPRPTDPAEQIKQHRWAKDALRRIGEDIEAGRHLQAEDVRNLTATTLENIKAKGDDYLKEIIRQLEEERRRDRDWGRERER